MTLALRPMVLTDAEVLASWATDPVFCAHSGWTQRSTADAAVPWWRAAIANPDPMLTRLLAVRSDEPVGHVDLHGDAVGLRELGFLIGPSHRWRQGLGSEAAAAGLAYGFTVLGLSRIWAEAVEANVSSVRILRGLGMRETGLGGSEAFLGSPSRYRRFSLSRDEWSPTAGKSPEPADSRPA
ncbi:N-acetyltransferase [Microbacterium foliorum]|uniref:N-acetyltransferase domain-containing protein n=1 Tax=Microbacterium foliorum TaxID=104336 RepID=A0A0F0L3Y6_9MICO|nr:GNAT family N-acetyltransferase [Microbacterium foliorum]AXL11558.1 N-acetyltransferase [Microbacterium foliorum]KJL27045.1 hypothetical protein RN50_00110 [Microbacterium foliorum]